MNQAGEHSWVDFFLKSAKTTFCFSEETTVLHNLPLWNANNKHLFFCTNPHHTVCKTPKNTHRASFLEQLPLTTLVDLSSWILRSKSTVPNPRGYCKPADLRVDVWNFVSLGRLPIPRKAASMTSSSLTLLKEVKKTECWKVLETFLFFAAFQHLAELVPQKMTQDFSRFTSQSSPKDLSTRLFQAVLSDLSIAPKHVEPCNIEIANMPGWRHHVCDASLRCDAIRWDFTVNALRTFNCIYCG